MSKLFIFGAAALLLAVFGCSSNPAGDITGPSKTTEANLPATQQQEFDWQDEYIGPPKFIELEVAAPAEAPAVAPGFYGEVSNLNLGAGTFSLTSPSGNTLNVVATPGAMVLYQGTFYDLAASPLDDGMNVSVTPYVSGLPEGVKIRATLIAVNSSPTNQALVNPD